MSKLILVFICAVLSGYWVQAQPGFPVTGNIKDAKGETLPGVTVFISGTKKITASNNAGSFVLSGVTPGTYVLIAKMIGFEPLNVPVTVTNSAVLLHLVLKESLNRLKEVVITSDPNWAAHFDIFKKYFLGTSSNAGNCKILNKEALHFHVDKASQTLTATADQLLVIENTALGYKINYSLESFEFNEKAGISRYNGNPVFQEMKPSSEKQQQAWQKNRQMAYNGSINHFMKSVIDNALDQQGFVVYSLINKPPVGEPYDPDNPIEFDPKPVRIDSLLTATDDANFKTLSFQRCLFVVYTKETESFNYQSSGYKINKPISKNGYVRRGQYSMINLLDNSVSLDHNGNYSPTYALLFEGYMGWEKVADLTPLEYSTEAAGH